MTMLATRRVVGVGDLLVSADADDEIVTYALGSCLGVAVHDPVAGVAGLLHAMLPQSSMDPQRAAEQPARFVDSGVPALFRECYRFGARKERMIVKVAGGSCAGNREEDDHFQIGKRNLVALRRLLWKNGVLVQAEDVGGFRVARTMVVQVASGSVVLRIDGEDHPL